jgi:hypothetical protein
MDNYSMYQKGQDIENIGRAAMGAGCSCFGIMFFGGILIIGILILFGILAS